MGKSSGKGSILSVYMFSKVSQSPPLPLKGLLPVKTRNKMTPMAQRSEEKDASSPFKTSGDKYSAVPTKSQRDEGD